MIAHQEGIGVEEGVDEARVHLLPVVEEELRMRGGSVVAPTAAASLLWTSVSVVRRHGLVLISGGMIKIRHCLNRLNYIFSEYQSAESVFIQNIQTKLSIKQTYRYIVKKVEG